MAQSTPTQSTQQNLDRRRRALLKRSRQAAAATRKLDEANESLTAHEQLTVERETELRAAMHAVAGLKKQLKRGKREEQAIRASQEDVRKEVAESQRRVSAAEAKYDRAVLHDVLQREKSRDLAEHALTPAWSSPDLEPHDHRRELPSGTRDEARKTQARKTANRAHATTI